MIYIVIPVFNRWLYTKACLTSLQSQTFRQFKTIVVDHGSTDGTSNYIEKEFPDTIILKGNQNMWWTAATNFGVKYALTQTDISCILTLNNDTLAEPDYIYQLFKAAKSAPTNSLIGSTAINVNTKEITYRGEQLQWFSESSIYLYKAVKHRPENGLLPVTHFPGRGILIPKAVFQRIGLFDEKFFPHYMADYDFTLRAAKAGYNIFCSWDAKVGTYPEASGANQLKANKSFTGYRQHLLGIRGGGNLPLFYRYVLRHCPVCALPSHLLLGTARRLIGYWL